MSPSHPASVMVYSGTELIGDGVMKLPFVRALRQAWPDARITWVAGTGGSVFADVLSELVAPYIDEVVPNAGIGLGWREVLRRPLPGRRFDLVLDTQRRVRTTMILRRIRHGMFVSGAAGYLLSDRRPAVPRRNGHMVDAMLALLEAASGRAPAPGRALSLPPRYTAAAEAALPHGRYVGIAPGAGGLHKRWPLDRFAGVANALAAAGTVPAFLLGPAEAGMAAAVRAACPAAVLPLQDPHIPADLARSPLFTIACATRLQAGVANDSGVGHLMAAAGIPLLSLFGPTDPAKFAPWATRRTILRAQDHGGPAMAAIPAAAVESALRGLLA